MQEEIERHVYAEGFDAPMKGQQQEQGLHPQHHHKHQHEQYLKGTATQAMEGSNAYQNSPATPSKTSSYAIRGKMLYFVG